LASIAPVNVDKPATVRLECNVDTPTTESPAPTRTSDLKLESPTKVERPVM